MFIAAVHGFTEAMRLLVNHGAPMGQLTLVAGCFGSQTYTVQFLLEKDCGPNVGDFLVLHRFLKRGNGPSLMYQSFSFAQGPK